MSKKCVICNEEAEYFVKGMENECYCMECAETNFNLDNLEKVDKDN